MKANELKYGNYIMISRAFEVARVSTITKRKIGYHLEEYESNLHYDLLQDIEPIDLNENIFLLFGFSKNNDTSYKYEYLYAKDNIYITVFKNEQNKIFIDAIGPNKRSYFEICSLHDFQQKLQDFINVNLSIEKVRAAVKRDLLIKKQAHDQQIIEKNLNEQEKKIFTIKL